MFFFPWLLLKRSIEYINIVLHIYVFTENGVSGLDLLEVTGSVLGKTFFLSYIFYKLKDTFRHGFKFCYYLP